MVIKKAMQKGRMVLDINGDGVVDRRDFTDGAKIAGAAVAGAGATAAAGA